MKIVKRVVLVFLVLVFVFAAIYVCGPHPSLPQYTNTLPNIPEEGMALEARIRAMESIVPLKADNEARIIWANDSTKQITDYAIVYLHGFSASQEEGNPVHRNIAKRFGCNLYLARLEAHGVDSKDPLENLNAENYWESVKEAYAIGKKLGKKVILMGTSTGGTNALQLASEFPEIAALILLSPNIEINDPNAWLANDPWGLQIARVVIGSKYSQVSDTSAYSMQYWSAPYRLEAVVELEEYLETTMLPETFNKIHQPILLLYYYRDRKHQDNTVRVEAMKRMFSQVQTPDSLKTQKAITKAEDHVIGNKAKSKDYQSVEKEVTLFLKNVLHLSVVE